MLKRYQYVNFGVLVFFYFGIGFLFGVFVYTKIGDNMIYNHRIGFSNDDEVLYLYFDFSFEIGKMGDMQKEEGILKEILEYIRKKKIDFRGKRILLCASGIVFGSLFFNYKTNTVDFSYYNNDNVRPVVQDVIYDDESGLDFALDEDEEVVDYVEQSEDSVLENSLEDERERVLVHVEEKVSNGGASGELNVNRGEANTQKVDLSSSSGRESDDEKDLGEAEEKKAIENIGDKESLEDKEEVKILNPVTVYLSSGEVITLELEDYLFGVLGAEMPASFHMEALKAGAVAARTYTLKYIEEGRRLTDGEDTQSFNTLEQMRAKWGSDFDKYYNRIKSAVLSTEGVCIRYGGKYIDAVYHASNNGYTTDATEVWGYDIPYLKSVESPYDVNSSSYFRKVDISLEEFNSKLGVSAKDESEIEVIRDETNHVKTFSVDGDSFSGLFVRNKFGLRSTDFDIVIEGGVVSIETRGYGHGVGMSQYGSNGMANAGYGYVDILRHYYSGVTIGK